MAGAFFYRIVGAVAAGCLAAASFPLEAAAASVEELGSPSEIALPTPLPQLLPGALLPEELRLGPSLPTTAALPSTDLPQAETVRPVQGAAEAAVRFPAARAVVMPLAAAVSPDKPDEPGGVEADRSNAGRAFDGPSGPKSGGEVPQITRHDGHRLQLKLDVRLVPGKKNVYRIGTYFFVPHALGITPETYTKDDFYAHTIRRLRFKTPAVPLAEILDKRNAASPLNRFSASLAKLAAGDKSAELAQTAYTEIRLLGKIASVALRDRAAALAETAATGEPAKLDEARAGTDDLVDDATRLMAKVRTLKTASAAAPDRIRQTAAFLEEFSSLSVVEHLTTLLAAIRSNPVSADALKAEDARLAGLIASEDAARAAAGYPSVVDKASGSEQLFYRHSVLTNFFSSALELENKTSSWTGAFQILFGLSAALAALGYGLAMQFAQGHLAMKGVALLLVTMAAYVVKDRFKDLFKIWTTRRWTSRFSDAVTAVRDPSTGRVVGKVRESFGFVPRSDLPPEILSIRQADPLAAVGEDGKPEDVLYYRRNVTLDPKAIERYHTRRRNLDDILLVNLAPFLDGTDDKTVDFSTLDPVTGKLEAQSGSRVHHINLVTRFDVLEPGETASTRFERRRVVMDRDGIKRVEQVSTTAAPLDP